MRFIKKEGTPEFFIEDTKDMSDWDDYGINREARINKRKLKKYILENEQNYLCGYCESKISIKNSHLEHIRPKFLDKKNLTFSYVNILVSCEGTCHNESGDNKKYHCGHFKHEKFNEEKFLNPVEVTDIRNYFTYDLDDFTINPSDKDIKKSNYMIETLNLNNEGLPKARDKASKNFREKLKKIRDIVKRKEKIKEILGKENIDQISFLRFKYGKYL